MRATMYVKLPVHIYCGNYISYYREIRPTEGSEGLTCHLLILNSYP